MGKPKLVYFDGRGRCEHVRFLFAAGKVSYEETRVEFADWPKLKPETPFGSLPTLTVGKVTLGQSLAIGRYAAKIAKMYGSKPLDQAKIDAIVDSTNELREFLFSKIAFEADEEVKKKKIEELPELANKSFDNLAKQLGANKFFVNNKMSWADIHFTVCVEALILGNFPDILDNHATLKALYDRVKETPTIAKYIKNRKETQF